MVAAACGGDDDEPTAQGTTTTTPPVQDVAADRAAAERAVLRLGDFPPGWQAEPPDSTPEDPELTSRLAGCLRVDLSLFEDVGDKASADAPDFESPDQQQVSNSVGLAPSAAKAQELFAIFERPELRDCLKTVLSQSIQAELRRPKPGRQLPPDLTVGEVTVNPVSFPTFGDRTVSFRVNVPFRAAGEQLTAYTDLAVAMRGRALTLLSFTDFGSAFPTDLAQRFTRTVVDRLPAA